MIDRSLLQIHGCLKHLRTDEGEARRRHPLDKDAWFPFSAFVRDLYQGIFPSPAYRRLHGKTQVFSHPENPYVRNRMLHSLEVASIAVAIAEILGLNTELVAAIAHAHDIGHAPFGHTGETFLSQVAGFPFRHEQFGVIVAQHIERKGQGLNLTWQTLRGILEHSRGTGELKGCSFPEATVVMLADKIAYTFADANDVGRCLCPLEELPRINELLHWFGDSQCNRGQRCITAICIESANKGFVSFNDSEEAEKFAELKKLMYEQVYFRLGQERLLENAYLQCAFDRIQNLSPEIPAWVVLALLTDHEVTSLATCQPIEIPKCFSRLSVAEIIPHLSNLSVDYTKVDLDW